MKAGSHAAGMRVLLAAAVASLAAIPPGSSAAGSEPARPRVKGIAHIALYVHDVEKARAFYTGFLGYTEPFQLTNGDGSPALTLIKINDRQYLELFPERTAGTDRLGHLGVETDDAEAMRVYLRSRGVAVPERVGKGPIGNTSFSVEDPDGHTVEFVQYRPDGWTAREKGKLMGPAAVSTTLRHAGILVGSLEPALTFYRDLLGFRETWRGSRDGKLLDWVNLQAPDGDDYVEFMLYQDLPEPTKRGSQHHLCLVVPDIAAAAAQMQARAAGAGYAQSIEPRTGINRKRQLNLFDPDGTRIELMEPQTTDGAPALSSAAPPPR